jgi:hypothetical protein
MLSALGASVDRRIANAIIVRARRRWLPLRLLPATCMRPLVKPAATLVRRKLVRTAARTTAIAGLLGAALLLLGGL